MNGYSIKEGVLFFDNNIGMWTIILYNEIGSQHGEAEHHTYKRDAMAVVNDWKAKGVTNWIIDKRG